MRTEMRFTPAEFAAVLARGIRAELTPDKWSAEIACLAERLSQMADARLADAVIARHRELAASARRDAALLKAAAEQLQAMATRWQPAGSKE